MQVSVEKHQSTRESQHSPWRHKKDRECMNACTLEQKCHVNHDWGSPEEEKESGLHWWKRQAKCCSTRSLSWVSPISTTTFRKDLNVGNRKENKTVYQTFYERACWKVSVHEILVILTSGLDQEFAQWSQRISSIPPRQHDWSHS